MSESSVLLAALGIVATCVAGLIWVIKYLFQRVIPMLDKINGSIEKNTKVTKANHQYLRNHDIKESEERVEMGKTIKRLTLALEKGR